MKNGKPSPDPNPNPAQAELRKREKAKKAASKVKGPAWDEEEEDTKALLSKYDEAKADDSMVIGEDGQASLNSRFVLSDSCDRVVSVQIRFPCPKGACSKKLLGFW